jgi:hypothetical protein
MPSDPATSQRGARREGGGGWAVRVRDLVAGGLKVGKREESERKGKWGWTVAWKGVKKQEVEVG